MDKRMTFEEWADKNNVDEYFLGGMWYMALKVAYEAGKQSTACCGSCLYWSPQWNICSNAESDEYNLPSENGVDKYCKHFKPRRKE